MSLNFTNILSKVRRATGTNAATYTSANIAIDVNLAQDEVWAEALKNAGWNIDDFNHTKHPIITTTLTAGQRDYSFTVDEQSNTILDVYKVQVKDATSGLYYDLLPVDQQSSDVETTMTDGANSQGKPTRYDKTGNWLFLDLVPDTTVASGLRVFIDREPSYFTSSDTTKLSGLDGLCHDFLYLKPAYEYCRDHDLPRAEKLFRDLQISMEKVKERYGYREKDVTHRMSAMKQDNE